MRHIMLQRDSPGCEAEFLCGPDLHPRPLQYLEKLSNCKEWISQGDPMNKDQLWQDLFTDPSQWWDTRFEKRSLPEYKRRSKVLWIESKPPWEKTELFAMMQGQAQSGWQDSIGHTAFERGPRERVSKNSSGTCDYQRTQCKGERLKEGLHTLDQQGIQADSKTYACTLQACIKTNDLAEGRKVHAHIIKSGLKPNVFLLNTLVNMYAKCGSLVDARQVFEKIHKRNLFTWTIMIAGYTKCGCAREAFEIYEQMICEKVTPDKVTFICVLNACAGLGALQEGKKVHAAIIKAGILPDIILETALAGMYAKCGSVFDARHVFDSMAERDVVSWNTMIAGYAQDGCGRQALQIYEQMQRERVTPDKVTFIGVLNACSSLGVLEEGKNVHAEIIKAGIPTDMILETALVDMYARCGSMNDADQVFHTMSKRDVVSWSTMIAGCAQHGCGREAFEIYEKMIQKGVMPIKVTFIGVLNACASLGALDKGKEIHADIISAGMAGDTVLDTALIDMYAKCGSMKDALRVFTNMINRDVVSWSAMIAGYAHLQCGREAFQIYKEMIQEGMTPNKITFISVLNACAGLAALEIGKEVHADIIKAGIGPDIILETALTDMYAKCGSIKDAWLVFENMAQRNVLSWNAMITGYAQNGCGSEALQLFEQMQHEGLKPDGITFVGLFSACSYVGLVDEGFHYFCAMTQEYGLTPAVEHFGCMVDLLCRAGRVDEAEDFIHKMPIKSDAGVWRALLAACRLHGDLEVAERAAENIINRDPHQPAGNVLFSNICVAAGRWEDSAIVRKLMEDIDVKQEPGHSCVETDNQLHTFIVENTSHPQIEEFNAG